MFYKLKYMQMFNPLQIYSIPREVFFCKMVIDQTVWRVKILRNFSLYFNVIC